MTNYNERLDEIERAIRSVLTPNNYIALQEGIRLTKAVLDGHNKQAEQIEATAYNHRVVNTKEYWQEGSRRQVEAVLDRLEGRARGAFDYEADIEEYTEDVLASIEAERNRLKETNYEQL